MTAHDHHEGPWGDRRQLLALIESGYVGDAVLLPEYLSDRLPISGRGTAIFEVLIRRAGEPVHEVLRPSDLPDVLGTGAELAIKLRELHDKLKATTHRYAGNDSVFIGKFTAGEIYNQSPVECRLNGTRRWITPGTTKAVREEFQTILDQLAATSRTDISLDFEVYGDAFHIDPTDPIVTSFQSAHTAVSGHPLPLGGKPFLDDGNSFSTVGGIPPITHGPNARGAHTQNEWVPVDELERIALVYALTAVHYCGFKEA